MPDAANVGPAEHLNGTDVARLDRLGDLLGPIITAHADVMAAERNRARDLAARLEAENALLVAALRGLVENYPAYVAGTWAHESAALEDAEAALATLDATT